MRIVSKKLAYIFDRKVNPGKPTSVTDSTLVDTLVAVAVENPLSGTDGRLSLPGEGGAAAGVEDLDESDKEIQQIAECIEAATSKIRVRSVSYTNIFQ